MKVYQFISTFLFLLIFSGCLSAQTITIGQFVVANTYLDNNNKIEVTDDADAPILIALSASRPSFFDKPVQLEAKLVFIGQNGEYDASSIVTFSTADFVGSSAFSINKENISATILSTNNNGQLKVKYRYYAQGYSGEPDGWTEWFTKTDKHYTTVNLTPVPVTTFVGPDQICDEGTYTITNPGVITLQNATNIATLTNLGNNQWKVTREVGASGIVRIKSMVSNNVYTKDVIVGTPLSAISGPSNIYALRGAGIQDAIFSVSLPIPGVTYTWSVVGGSPGRVIFPSGTTGTSVIIHVKNHDNLGTNPFNYTMRLTTTNTCGTSSYSTHSLKVHPAQPGGGPL
ncbi:hypothetical protein FAZ15_10970 [Sphingobacterium olei]|uniref:Uncharacterized protein n=1 Tax=Sphingobacterium olei TaxID=2571155 RepID=A0A4U0P079_9SPHI|nr:hypothetical protein [Sphingobacterium olei]TJZ60513.1 hypothetical protein FAZ15_10970 [Sphingobacterium olei]